MNLIDEMNLDKFLVKKMPDVLWVSDETGTALYVTENVSSIIGHCPDEICGNGFGFWGDKIHPEDMAAVRAAYDAVFHQGAGFDIKYRIRRKDGEWCWVSNRSIDVFQFQGTRCAAGVMTDFSQGKSLEDALIQGKREWEATFDAVPYPVFIHDKASSIIRANMAYRNMAGMDFREFIGRPYYCVFPRMNEPFQSCFAAHDQQRMPDAADEIPCGNNTVFRNRSFALPHLKKDGDCCIHFIVDITHQKLSEEALRQSEIKYRHLFDNLNDAVFLIDGHTGLIIETNVRGEKLTGRSREEIIGTHRSELHPQDKNDKRFVEQINIEHLADFDWEVLRKDGGVVPVRISAEAKEINNQSVILYMVRDITERKKMEQRWQDEVDVTSQLLMINDATSGTENIDRLMEQTAACGYRLLRCSACLTYLWEHENHIFRPAGIQTLRSDLIPVFKARPLSDEVDIIERCFKTGEPVTTTAVEIFSSPSARYFLGWLGDAKAVSIIPLIGRLDRLGLIIGVHMESLQVRERDIVLMKGMSNQVSIALDRAKLYKETVSKAIELSHKIETIQVLHEIDRNLLSTLRVGDILEVSVMLITRLISCERANILIVDKGKDGFVYAAGFGMTGIKKGEYIPFADTSATDVVKTARPQYEVDTTNQPQLLPLEAKFLKEGFRSRIRVPLASKKDVIGVLTLAARSPAAFTAENVATLEKISSQISVALENARLIADLDDLFRGTIKALSSAIDAKSKWTSGHSERVTQYAVAMAYEMRLGDAAVRDIEMAGLLHDIGKIGTYELVLNKTDKLSDEEFRAVKEHPVKGAQIVAHIKQMDGIIPAIRHHHERFDGTGYPDRLRGGEIPVYARILAVADAADAMLAGRPYRKGIPMKMVIEELRRCSGAQFDPDTVHAFVRASRKKPAHPV